MTTAASQHARSGRAAARLRLPVAGRALVALAALSALACGSRGGSEGTPPDDRQLPPAILAGEGAPTGEAAGAAIGAEGGTLASPDGRLTVVVPPGAVPGGASFTVQPITNTALGGVEGAFRLGPEGLTFATPVTLVFRGPETYAAGTDIQGLGIAYQDASGFWRPVERVVRDAAANTLSVETTHFSDWGLTWQDGVPGLYGGFTLSQTLGAVPFDATGAATLFYQGQSDTITLYVLTGSVSPATSPATCSYATQPPVETLVPTTAQIWSSPAQFRWAIDAAWELTCSDGPAEQLMAAIFDTTGLSMATAGCVRGYEGTPVIGTDGTSGTYTISCGTSGSATATWDFDACIPGVECTDPALNPCVTQAISCTTPAAPGWPICTETGTHVEDGTVCGTDQLCSVGVCTTLEAIAVTPADPTVLEGETVQFAATGTYSDGREWDLTSQAIWVSSSTAAATVDAAGLATAVAAGTTTISATSGSVSGSTSLTVLPILVSIAVTPADPTVVDGDAQQFTATGTYTDASTQDLTTQVTWASSATAVATIDASGLATNVAPVGTTTISATLGAVSGSTTLTVIPRLLSIAVTPADSSLAAGYTRQFTATGTYSDATTQDLTASVTWASSNVAAATIDAAGLATTLAEGTSTISATSGSVSGATTLTVLPPELLSIAVTPASPSIAAGYPQQFTATGSYSDGSNQDLTATVSWASSVTAFATIDAAGLATTLAAGTTTISATSGTVSGSTTLTVLPPELLSIAVTPASPSIAAGYPQQFTATGSYSDGSNQDLTATVSWASSVTAFATIDAAGLATTLAAGTTTISATSGTVSGSTTLTVLPPELLSIAVTPASPSIAAGYPQQFTATGTYSDASSQDLTSTVTWASSATAFATIDATGLATTLAAGATTISATSGTVSGSTTLTVLPPELLSIAVTPASPSIAAGYPQQFTATGSYSDGSNQDLTATATWASSATAFATIDATGLATTLAAGTTTISATSGTVSGSTTLTVLAAELLSIEVTPATPSVAAGYPQQFMATGSYSDSSTQDLTGTVTWASSATAFATIDATGLATTLAAGTTTISATSGTVSGSTTLTVLPPELLSIAVTPASPSIAAGYPQQFTATGSYSDGSTLDLTATATWASSATAFATIDAAGLATTLAAGTTTISATSGTVSGSTTLTVLAAELLSIEVTPATPSIVAGYTQQFTATGSYSDGSNQDLTATATWGSSATAYATIDATGLATTLAPGTTTISATSGSVSGSTTLTVLPAELLSIAVTPATPSVVAGYTQQFTATGTYSDGSTLDLTATATWASSATAFATIDAAGLATTLAAGTTTISATSGSVSGSTTLTVLPAELVSITVTPATPSVVAGYTQQFTATGTYSDGSTLDLTATATWVSSVTAFATIDATGLATTLAAGSTTISATSGTVSGSTTLTVLPAELLSIAVTPATPSVMAGYTQQFTATGTYSDGSTLDLTATATWASSATAFATIDATGLATTLAAGTTTISATSGSVSGSATLTVLPAELLSIAVTPATPSVVAGYTQQFTATGTYSDGSTLDLTATATWASSVTAFATIDATGLATTLAAGTTTISATSGSVSGSATLTVLPAELLSIAVTPANPSVVAGYTQQFTATGTYSDGSTLDLTATATWASSVTSFATIDAAGLATTLAAGTTTISAASGTVSGNTTLTVLPAELLSIEVTPANPSIVAGYAQQFTATGTYSDGSTLDLTATATWGSSATAFATIDAAGLATTLAAGTTTISATSGSVNGNTTLTILPAELVSITVTPATPSVVAGYTQQFTATGTYSDGSTLDLTATATWASSATAFATIDAAGLATTLAAGTTTISATSGSVNGNTTLTVLPAELVSITVTPATPSVVAGYTQQFIATGTYSDGSTLDLTATATWASSATAFATIDAAGLATTLAAGTTTISATSGSVSGSTTLTVLPAELVSITVTPATPSVVAGYTQQFTATGTYSDGSTQNLTAAVAWASSAPGFATIDATGLATTIAAGTTTITATLGSVSGNTTLTVLAAELLSIEVTPATPSVVAGYTQQFTAIGTYSDGSTLDLTATAIWASSATAFATIDATGLATTVAAGTTTISATSGSVSGSTTLTVLPAELLSIAVTPATPSVVAGYTHQFTATGTYSDGSTLDLTATATWASSVTAFATIDATGLATTVAAGTTTISATSGSVSGGTTLTVLPAELLSIAVTPATPSVVAGYTQQFTATGTYSDGSTLDLTATATWASSVTAFATIDATGLATTLAAGTTTISATSGSVSGSTTLTILPAELLSIEVTPANPSVVAGLTQQFTATGTYSDGSTLDLTATATWASSVTAYATIDAAGLATTLAAGTTTISATSGTISGSTTLTVLPAELVSIAIAPSNPSIVAGYTQQFTATGTYSDGSTLDLTATATWASSVTAYATIDAAGLATTVAEGITTISATQGGVSGSTTLTVLPAELLTIVVTPADPSVAAGYALPFTATGTYSDGSIQDLTAQVTWGSSNTAVAIVDAAGLATTLAEGITTISATLDGVSGGTTLTALPAELLSIAVTPATPSVIAGYTQQFTATGTYSDGSTLDLTGTATWASSATGFATIDAAGLATTLAAGTTTISATSGSVSGSTTLTVLPAELLSIAVTPADPSVAAGYALPFTATGTYSDGSTLDLTATVTWASSSPAAATIDATGLATTLAEGTTTISATSGGVSGSTTLTVLPAELLTIAVAPAAPAVLAGETQQFTATGTYSDGSTQDLTATATWASSEPTLATIDAAGLATTLAAGATTISATLGGVSGSTTLTVLPTLVSIAVTPVDPSVLVTGMQQFTATGTYSDSSTQDLTALVTWDSSLITVASIDATGLATALAAGATTISATLDGVSGATTLTVTSP